MLKHINQIAYNCPTIQFWLPTKERDIVLAFEDLGHRFAKNLCLRLSDYHVDKKETLPLKLRKFPRAGVVTDKEKVTCPAYKQGGKCGSCRKCWDKKVKYTKYPLH